MNDFGHDKIERIEQLLGGDDRLEKEPWIVSCVSYAVAKPWLVLVLIILTFVSAACSIIFSGYISFMLIIFALGLSLFVGGILVGK